MSLEESVGQLFLLVVTSKILIRELWRLSASRPEGAVTP